MRPRSLLAGLTLLLAVLFVVSLLIGPAALDPLTSLRGLIAGGDEAAIIIMREVRLPRAILALLVGVSLGLSGAALQGFLRNPLAEPGIVGVSATASLGAVLIFYSGLAGSSLLALPAGALAGALVAVVLLLAIAAGNTTTLTLILAGVALSSLAGALTSLVLNLSPNPFASYEIIFWLLGSIKDRSMSHVWLSLPLMAAGWLLILASARALDALSFGEETATSLGIDLPRSRVMIVAGVALAVDIAARVVVPARELNVGVLTALIGAPFFLWLVIRSRREAP